VHTESRMPVDGAFFMRVALITSTRMGLSRLSALYIGTFRDRRAKSAKPVFAV